MHDLFGPVIFFKKIPRGGGFLVLAKSWAIKDNVRAKLTVLCVTNFVIGSCV